MCRRSALVPVLLSPGPVFENWTSTGCCKKREHPHGPAAAAVTALSPRGREPLPPDFSQEGNLLQRDVMLSWREIVSWKESGRPQAIFLEGAKGSLLTMRKGAYSTAAGGRSQSTASTWPSGWGGEGALWSQTFQAVVLALEGLSDFQRSWVLM